ncbi:hypothetical protein NSTC745_01885 [Nostoc sp. DSM 114161]
MLLVAHLLVPEKAMTDNKHEKNQINQPVSEDWHSRKEPTAKERNLTANPGDKIDDSQSVEEKAQQVAVDSPDITGDHITVPTYFVVDEPDGEKKALHHVKDAEEISDVIRQARVDENGNRVWW